MEVTALTDTNHYDEIPGGINNGGQTLEQYNLYAEISHPVGATGSVSTGNDGGGGGGGEEQECVYDVGAQRG